MKTVYYNPEGPRIQEGFGGGGSAWWVSPEPDSPWDERFRELQISEQLFWAMWHLGVIEGFSGLPSEGPVDHYEEGILLTSGLPQASEILLQRAQNISEGIYEWRCGSRVSPPRIEYKVRVKSDQVKRDLIALAEFLLGAASRGYDVQFWL
ncbi:hypothetical protein ACFL2Q_02510 [Thermodesulfobacteriota bacterium]